MVALAVLGATVYRNPNLVYRSQTVSATTSTAGWYDNDDTDDTSYSSTTNIIALAEGFVKNYFKIAGRTDGSSFVQIARMTRLRTQHAIRWPTNAWLCRWDR